MSEIPALAGDAKAAVEHRGSHAQIIAAAGSGKTEVVSQRVASLLADGVPARSIVAFTFTEKAAAELKNRIALRVSQTLGEDAENLLTGLYVGTIHAFAFRLLQQYVPIYETYDVLDENQLAAFLSREANRLKLRDLSTDGRLFNSIQTFTRTVDVIENEVLLIDQLEEPFRSTYIEYLETLKRYRLLTYGQQIDCALKELSKPEVATEVHANLQHLIVDEYQDVNPAQERLIELLTGPNTVLCVVGDDDQAIYQWRGSDVANIVTFGERFPNVATFSLTINRRSRPQIIEAANQFGRTIAPRLNKTMAAFRDSNGDGQIQLWTVETELEEAGYVANHILDLASKGVAYGDIAILVRSRAAYPKLLEQLATFDIPVQPGGRTGLFEQPEANVLGRTMAWLASIDWSEQYGQRTPVVIDDLLHEYQQAFEPMTATVKSLRVLLNQWKEAVADTSRRANLVGDLYDLLEHLGVSAWSLDNPLNVNRMGTLARFSSLLADYESVRQRARPDAENEGEQVGGEDRGAWYYKNLAVHIVNYAQGTYEGFDGEPDFALNAVELLTVHGAKGLEWPVVFVPSVTANRFPTTNVGRRGAWFIPRELFAATRYEGTDADERRLFYVAMTRARDWLSISRHERVNVKAVRPSPYFDELRKYESNATKVSAPPVGTPTEHAEAEVQISYSDLASFLDCGMMYRLRKLIGFQPKLAPELNYGKAVHHVLRTVADITKATGEVPTDAQLDDILRRDFFLPTANKPAHRQLKDAARRLVASYTRDFKDDLFRIWESERPFELHLDGVTVEGRADVILDKEGGEATALAILDYKTSSEQNDPHHDLQLQIYANAGRKEGLDVRAAYVHDLKEGAIGKRTPRKQIDISPDAIAESESVVGQAAKKLRAREYVANPGPRCSSCEVRSICSFRK